MNIKTNAKFVVTISDGYCAYSYPLDVSDKMSVTKIARRIQREYRKPVTDGTYEPDNIHDGPAKESFRRIFGNIR